MQRHILLAQKKTQHAVKSRASKSQNNRFEYLCLFSENSGSDFIITDCKLTAYSYKITR